MSLTPLKRKDKTSKKKSTKENMEANSRKTESAKSKQQKGGRFCFIYKLIMLKLQTKQGQGQPNQCAAVQTAVTQKTWKDVVH